MIQNISQPHNSVTDKLRMPDILVISRTFFPKEGGIEEYVYNRCLQDPNRVILLAASYPGDAAFDAVQPFRIYRWQLPAFLHKGKLAGILKQIINMVCSFLLAIKLYFRYRYRYIEWAHGYDFPSLLLLTYILPIQCFMYLHGNDVLCPVKNPVLRLLFEWTLKRCTGVVCNSYFTQDYLNTNFHITTPTHIINPSVRPEKFQIGDAHQAKNSVRSKYNIPETAVLILSVGRLVKRKGFDRVIENLPLLLADGLDVHYLICGRGEMAQELKSKSESLGVAQRVHFAGYVSNEQLADYYMACDLFAMFTFYDTQAASIEGFGIVYLEAGYFGKPVIASRVGGVTDAVYHTSNGILVDPDSDEISSALKQLCTDRRLREQLGSKGQHLAKRKTPHSILYSKLDGVKI
ncbi:putative glycosyl transferase [Calothrix sp. NIES-4071]|nr:putative glycosyl transferase [Calothrix sp. NIES-4071]BAZ55865.1 putative glycosyl transferase [Calothrix sp. NIES-4105]